MKKIIYLDNNGTTKLCKEGKCEMVKWLDRYANPSTNSIISKDAGELINSTKKQILAHCDAKDYTVVITSGASESNCLILRSTADVYRYHTEKIPHIITSAIEHKSILDCCNDLITKKLATISFVQPDIYGCTRPQIIEKEITENTALISIMIANNEIGCINNIKEIGRIAHEHKIPLHTDAVQYFGKYKLSLPEYNIDAMTVSFHKFHGPVGIGLLIINNKFIEGYGINGQISGTQQNNLRGGTENIAAISACVPTLKHVFKNRISKNERLYMLRNRLIAGLESKIHKGELSSYIGENKNTENEFIVFGPPSPYVLPNTILMSFVKNKNNDKPFCNKKLKKYMADNGVIVAIGSACSTDSKSASHVINAFKTPLVVRQGVIRISMSDLTTPQEIKKTVSLLIKGAGKQMKL